MRVAIPVIVACLLTSCRAATETEPGSLVRVRDCEGPALSLDPAVVATLPPRTGMMHPDDRWADLAASVPGGFAGVLLDDGQPVVMLTEPEKAAEAKAALAGQIPGFPIESATPRQARWDFEQLVDWFRYLQPQLGWGGVLSADKDEVHNRIRFGVLADTTIDRVVAALNALEIPCDLVVLRIEQPAVAVPAR